MMVGDVLMAVVIIGGSFGTGVIIGAAIKEFRTHQGR